MSNSIFHYTYPRSCPKADDIQVIVGGEPLFVYRTAVADFCVLSFDGKIDVKVQCKNRIDQAIIRPVSYNVTPTIIENTVCFTLTKQLKLHIDINGRRPLYFYSNPIEEDVPSANQEGVHFFKAGQIYEVDEFHLKDGETLYIEGGAAVRGCIEALKAKNIRICGRGILDGGYYGGENGKRRTIRLRQCESVIIEGIVMIQPSIWMIMLWGCKDVNIFNIKQIGEVPSSDGVDIVGSKNIRIEDCFMRNNDDCIVIKAIPDSDFSSESDEHMWDVENVRVKKCVLINDNCGNAMEIGHELRTASIKDIVFEDCDVLSVHGHGAVFSIHNADRAVISDILYKNIRIEHYFDKLIDFRILKSMWGHDNERGQVRNIKFEDIFVTNSIYNPGYSTSIIGGFDAQHTIEDVCIKNIYLNGEKVKDADGLDLYIKNASNINII